MTSDYKQRNVNQSMMNLNKSKMFLPGQHRNFILDKNGPKLISEEEQYFLTCFDPSDSTIFFYEFFSNKVIVDPNITKKNIEEKVIKENQNNDNNSENHHLEIQKITNNQLNQINKDEKYYKKELITHFNNMWKKIKSLSEFEYNYFSSEYVKEKYFKKPLLSRFLNPEILGKTFISSTFPLPQCFSRYEKVTLNIYYHDSVSSFCKDVRPILFQKEVGLFYVVDTLIKDSIIYIKRYLENLKNNNYESEIQENTKENEKNNEFDYLDKLEHLINNPRNKFILKLCLLEDYIYGDIPICQNENIRRKIRERERINLLLMKLDENEIKPNISNFPFIIQVVERQGYCYDDLLSYFLNKIDFKNDNLNDKSVIFMVKPDFQKKNDKNVYEKKKMKRREYLKKYTESGECDYPFIISIKSITNLTSIINHICSDYYEFNHMVLLNFKKKKKIKKNILETILKYFMFCCKNKNSENEEEEKKQQQHEAKLSRKRENEYSKEKILLNELNFMEYTKNNQEEIINLNNRTKIQNFSSLKSLKDYYKSFSDKKSDNNDYFKDCNNKINYFDSDSETYYSPFSMIKEYINFLPTHVVLEVSLVYGLNKIRVFVSKGCLIKEDIIINEKINFSQFKKIDNKKQTSSGQVPDYDFLYFSNIPRESRLCLEILCFDSEFHKNFTLGSGSIQVYDEHGFLKSGIQEVYIWPFFENDEKVPSSAPFHRKINSDQNEEFNKNNYGIIYLEFPKFREDLLHTFKSPESYSDYLKIRNKTYKHNKYNIPQFSKFYNNALTNTDNIIKNIFKSFYNFDDNNDKISNNNNNEKEETAFFLNKNELESLLKILTIEPLRKISYKERELIINSRDYISTIPSKLELFLRCINWFDPIQADIARTYLNKWSKIDILDAIGLLDARFPNIYVREYALKIINESTDDLKDLYMLQIIYGLMYEPYYESYITDFIIENSLKRPYFGSKFIIMSKLLKDHPMFTEKICIIITHILMLSGTKFINQLEKTLNTSKLFLNISKRSKALKEQNKWDKNTLNKNIKIELNNLFLTKEKISQIMNERKNQKEVNNDEEIKDNNNNQNIDISIDIENIINEKVNSTIPEYQDFNQGAFLDGSIPVFSSFYFSDVNFDNMKAQDSKMVPIDYTFYPSEGNVRDFIGKMNPLSNLKSFINIFFKNGDDLRQDHLALQALRTMDRLWLENDLDLKVFGYAVLPAGQKHGFMEKCEALPYNSVQTGKSISGIFDRELIKKYFDKKAQEIVDALPFNSNFNKQTLIDDIKLKQVDNFVRSLAGYCVATCVLGIADRHSDNIMIQDNGIFLHIDYGHILGNFKEKLGFKREKSKFVLDQTMMNFCKHYNMEEEFKYFCVRAYNILRKNANRLLNLFIIMSSSGMPELYSLNNIKYFIDMLKLDKKNDEDAGNYFLCLINQSKNDKYRYFDNIFHNINHLKVGEKKEKGKDNKKSLEKLENSLGIKKLVEKKN